MEIWQKEDICIDALWNIIYTEASYFNKKVNLMSYIYNDILEKTNNPKTQTLSLLAKKKLYENNITKYFSAVRDAALKTIVEDTDKSEMDLDGEILNERGFARLSVLSNINSDADFSPKVNKNIFLALGNCLKDFSLENTDYAGKGLFEVVYRYMEKHRMLFTSTPKAIANSFCSNIDNTAVVNNLEMSFKNYLKKRIDAYKKDLKAQNSDEFSIKVINDVLAEIDKEYTLFSTNFNSVLAKNIPQRIIDKYKPKDEEETGTRKRK